MLLIISEPSSSLHPNANFLVFWLLLLRPEYPGALPWSSHRISLQVWALSNLALPLALGSSAPSLRPLCKPCLTWVFQTTLITEVHLQEGLVPLLQPGDLGNPRLAPCRGDHLKHRERDMKASQPRYTGWSSEDHSDISERFKA